MSVVNIPRMVLVVRWIDTKQNREGMIHDLSSNTGPPNFPNNSWFAFYFPSTEYERTSSHFQGWNIDIIRTYSKPPIYKGIQTWTKQCMKVINSSRWFGYGMFVNNYSTIPGIVVPNVWEPAVSSWQTVPGKWLKVQYCLPQVGKSNFNTLW